MPRSSLRNSSGRRNFAAAFVTVLSVGVLYSSFDPVPAGEDPLVAKNAPVVPTFQVAEVPLPPEASGLTPLVNSDRKARWIQRHPRTPPKRLLLWKVAR